jgi:hypothetical protein
LPVKSSYLRSVTTSFVLYLTILFRFSPLALFLRHHTYVCSLRVSIRISTKRSYFINPSAAFVANEPADPLAVVVS